VVQLVARGLVLVGQFPIAEFARRLRVGHRTFLNEPTIFLVIPRLLFRNCETLS